MHKYSPLNDGITQSILSSFLKCRVASRFNLDGITPIKTGPALQFGEMAHNVLEHVYTNFKKCPSQQEVLDLIEEQVTLWENSEKGQRSSAEEAQQLQLNAAMLDAVLPHYFIFWAKEDFKKVVWVDLEKEFSYQKWGVTLRGKIDGVYRANGKLGLLETKTKSRIEEGVIEEMLSFDFQTDFYSLAAKEIYGSYPYEIRYNVIRRPGQKLGKTESLREFKDRIEAEVKADPKKYFIRFRVAKIRQKLLSFEKELEIIIKDFVAWNDGKIPSYKNVTACMDRYGTCRYLPICSRNDRSLFYTRQNMFQELSNAKSK